MSCRGVRRIELPRAPDDNDCLWRRARTLARSQHAAAPIGAKQSKLQFYIAAQRGELIRFGRARASGPPEHKETARRATRLRPPSGAQSDCAWPRASAVWSESNKRQRYCRRACAPQRDVRHLTRGRGANLIFPHSWPSCGDALRARPEPARWSFLATRAQNVPYNVGVRARFSRTRISHCFLRALCPPI